MRKGYSTCAFNASAQGKLMRITAPAWPAPSIRKPSLLGSNCALARPTVLLSRPLPAPYCMWYLWARTAQCCTYARKVQRGREAGGQYAHLSALARALSRFGQAEKPTGSGPARLSF